MIDIFFYITVVAVGVATLLGLASMVGIIFYQRNGAFHRYKQMRNENTKRLDQLRKEMEEMERGMRRR